MALSSVTLTGTFLNADGTAAAGQVSFTPSAQIADSHDIVVLPQTPVTRSLDSTGAFSVKLLPTDAAGLTPTGWTYTVTIHVGGGSPVTFSILLPSTPNPVDLSAIAPAVPQPSVIQYLPVGGGTLTGTLILAGSPPVRIAAGASSGYVLTCDASGNASWSAAPAGVPSGTVVNETGYGQAASAGAAGAYSRGDHTHGSPALASTAASASAVGDAATAGSATTPARADHVHGREPFAAPGNSAVGDAAAAGVSTSVSRADHIHGRETFAAPGPSAVADTIAAGTSASTARADHRHGREAFGPVTAQTGYGTASADGAATTLAHSDHVHGTPALGTSGTTAAAGNDSRFANVPAYPPSGYGLVAVSIDPDTCQGSAGINNELRFVRLFIPAGKSFSKLWAGVRTAGVWDTVTTPNQLLLYSDAGIQLDSTANDGTLWAGTGWRGGTLQGGTQAAQAADRYVYVTWSIRGMTTNPILPFPPSANDSNSTFAAVGVAGGNRRAFYAAGTATPPASVDPTTYGTATCFVPVVGCS